jgi:hypothetical protein
MLASTTGRHAICARSCAVSTRRFRRCGLRPVVRERDSLEARWAQEQRVIESLRHDLATARDTVVQEHAARHAAETAAALATARAQAFEDLLHRARSISPDEKLAPTGA